MKKILFILDDILIMIGCILMVVGGYSISPTLSIYTAAIECFVIAWLYGKAFANVIKEQKNERG